MLDTRTIETIATQVARKQLRDSDFERIMSESTTDSEGNEALRITIVLKPEATQKLTGDNTIDLLVGIRQKLRAEGEERFPIIEYATEQELAEDEDRPKDADAIEDEV